MTNPYQAPETIPEGPLNVDYGSLPIVLPRRSRIDRVYLILLGLWAGAIATLPLWDADRLGLVDLMFSTYFVGLVVADIGAWRWNRTAQVIAIVQLGIGLFITTLFLGLSAWVVAMRNATLPPDIAITILLIILLFFLPTIVLLVLGVLAWRQHS